MPHLDTVFYCFGKGLFVKYNVCVMTKYVVKATDLDTFQINWNLCISESGNVGVIFSTLQQLTDFLVHETMPKINFYHLKSFPF